MEEKFISRFKRGVASLVETIRQYVVLHTYQNLYATKSWNMTYLSFAGAEKHGYGVYLLVPTYL